MPFLRSSSPPGQKKPESPHVPHAPRRVYALITVGALGMLLGQPNPLFHLPPLVLAFPFSLCLLALLAPSGAKAFFHCWLLGLAGHAAGLYWLVNPMHDVGGLRYELAWPGVLLLSAYLACYSGLSGFGMRRLRRFRAFEGPEKTHVSAGADADASASSTGSSLVFAPLIRLVPAAFLAGCAYAGFETLCGSLFTGFPWLSLSSAFSLWPVWVQAASLIGSYGLSACFAAAACLGASAFLVPSPPGRIAVVILALALTAAFPLYGALRLAAPPSESADPPLSLIMVQGNIDQNQKWDPLFQESTLAHYLRMSSQALQHARLTRQEDSPDLVLWPETAMPFSLRTHPEHTGRLRRFAAEHNVNLAFGTLGLDRDPQDSAAPPQMYNRLYLLSANGGIAGFYDKQHLVPFGEYIPFASSLTFLRNIAQGLDFSSGVSNQPLTLARTRPDPLAAPSLPPAADGETRTPAHWTDRTERHVPLGVLICYEAIFPSLAQKRVANGATVLINVSNDGWFGKSSAPLQHLGLTVMRAVEQARPIARATNTGYTVAIDSRGRVTECADRLFLNETLFASVRPSSEITVYHRIHPVPEVLLVAAAFFSLCGAVPRKSKPSHS